MAINPALLICAPMLQDLLVDVNGQPMAGGTITCYSNTDPSILKNWYYQSGSSPGPFTYLPLDNPLTLSAAGTITDPNGVDTLPFYYPWSESDPTVAETYYIVIVNAAMTNTITRSDFPYNTGSGGGGGGGGGGGNPGVNAENYVINNRFWRNIGTATLSSVTATTPYTVCPSQHDGFQYPDIVFIKDAAVNTDSCAFLKFPTSLSSILKMDITPEFYLQHTCTTNNPGETYKYYQFPLSLHLATLVAQPFTVTIQAQNVGGTGPGQGVISLYLQQGTGTGTAPPAASPIGTATLSSGWLKYTFTSVTPGNSGVAIGAGGDDALYLQVWMPIDVACTINFCLPSFYLGAGGGTVPVNDFSTYDQIDAIINSPRTGDIRTSVNSFYPWGWVPMNNGTIGNASSNATARANQDTWQLFNLIWTFAVTYDSGSDSNPIAQMYTSAGAATNYGATAIADFSANKALALTQMLGNVIMGTVPIAALTALYSQSVAATSSGGILFTLATASPAVFYTGQPVTFTAGTYPDGILANAVYYVVNPSPSSLSMTATFNVAISFANAIAGTTVSYSTAGSTVVAIFQTSGAQIGEYDHTMLNGEMVAHYHLEAYSTTNTPVTRYGSTSVGGSIANYSATGNSGLAPNTSTVGGNNPFNILQPATLYNIFIKL